MKCNQSGFTLIEIIVTVVIVAILSAMILTFLSDSLVKSSDPVKRFQKTTELNKITANIMADYNKYPKWRSTTLYAVGNYVVPTIRNGHYYKCTAAGTSGANEPDWPLTAGGTKSDGTITWTETAENGPFLTLTNLQSNINSKNYGTYGVVENKFVQFPLPSNVETAGGSKILKVTIKNDPCDPQTCVTITSLFISN
ncbi:MAG: prepilin-type N-terminal cleavage/methylation domain-containing protein [Deltaproteobacteria bacterium]|nr:prepilin-type N-terminal cleavage/methylation domain-containing protein [Deltaproteobacteria bacterium]